MLNPKTLKKKTYAVDRRRSTIRRASMTDEEIAAETLTFLSGRAIAPRDPALAPIEPHEIDYYGVVAPMLPDARRTFETERLLNLELDIGSVMARIRALAAPGFIDNLIATEKATAMSPPVEEEPVGDATAETAPPTVATAFGMQILLPASRTTDATSAPHKRLSGAASPTAMSDKGLAVEAAQPGTKDTSEKTTATSRKDVAFEAAQPATKVTSETATATSETDVAIETAQPATKDTSVSTIATSEAEADPATARLNRMKEKILEKKKLRQRKIRFGTANKPGGETAKPKEDAAGNKSRDQRLKLREQLKAREKELKDMLSLHVKKEKMDGVDANAVDHSAAPSESAFKTTPQDVIDVDDPSLTSIAAAKSHIKTTPQDVIDVDDPLLTSLAAAMSPIDDANNVDMPAADDNSEYSGSGATTTDVDDFGYPATSQTGGFGWAPHAAHMQAKKKKKKAKNATERAEPKKSDDADDEKKKVANKKVAKKMAAPKKSDDEEKAAKKDVGTKRAYAGDADEQVIQKKKKKKVAKKVAVAADESPNDDYDGTGGGGGDANDANDANDEARIDDADDGANPDDNKDNGPTKSARNKRYVGTPAKSVPQMKDAIVRSQAVIVTNKLQILQAMTTYDAEQQRANNPQSYMVLVCVDQIVTRPDEQPEGCRKRVIPKVTFMVPKGLNRKQMAKDLGQTCKAVQEDDGKKKKLTKKELKKRGFEYEFADLGKEMMHSVYGPPIKKATKENNAS